ncbi:MAG TPA: hemerythrin domain-containing protein [Nakamurella sp.]
MTDSVQDGTRMNSLIHRAVRRDLDDFARALDSFPAGDRDRAAAVVARFQWFDRLLTSHHEGEEEILWPVLRTSPPTTEEVGELTDEHERIVAALAAARAAFAQFGASATAADATSAASAVRELNAAATEHFTHEESEIVELCSKADPVALKAAFKKLGRRAGPREGLWFMQWVSDGASSDDKAFLRTVIPSPVHWISKTVVGRSYATSTAPIRVSS